MLSPGNSPVIRSYQTLNILLRGGRIISDCSEKRKASVCCLSVCPSVPSFSGVNVVVEAYAPTDSPGAAQRCTRPATFLSSYPRTDTFRTEGPKHTLSAFTAGAAPGESLLVWFTVVTVPVLNCIVLLRSQKLGGVKALSAELAAVSGNSDE